MSNREIVAVKCPECHQMVGAGETHACWSHELGMRAFEDAMWARYQASEAIEPLEEAGQDCPHCPKGDNGHHQYQIEQGCYVDGKPSCKWCAMTEAVWEKWQEEDIEASGQRWTDSQTDQNYYAQCAAEGYNPDKHDRSCDCPECCGDIGKLVEPVNWATEWEKHSLLDYRKGEF